MIKKIIIFLSFFLCFGIINISAFSGDGLGSMPPPILDGDNQQVPPNQQNIDIEEVVESELDTDTVFKLGVTDIDNISTKNAKGEWEGFDIDVFDSIAKEIGLNYEIVEFDSIDGIIAGVENEEIDFGVGLLTMQSDKLKSGLQFSYPYLYGGTSILLKSESSTYTPNVLAIFFSWYVWKTIIIVVLVIFIVGNIYHFVVDRKKKSKWMKNRDLSLFYTPQIFKAIWFASVKNGLSHIDSASAKNHHPISKFVVIPIWIFGFIITSLITGQIVADITSERLILEIDDTKLSNKMIAVTKDSDFYNMLENNQDLGEAYVVETFDDAIDSVISGKADGLIAENFFIDIAQSKLAEYSIESYKAQENLSEDYYAIAMNKQIVHKYPLVYLKVDYEILEKIENLEIKKIRDYWTK